MRSATGSTSAIADVRVQRKKRPLCGSQLSLTELEARRAGFLGFGRRNRPTGDFYIPEFSAPKLRVGVAHRQAAQYVDAAHKRYSRFVENRLHAP